MSELTFYRNPAVPIKGVVGNTWKSPGMALSASSVFIFPGSRVKHAQFTLAWTPNATSGGYNGVRLMKADSGPSNMIQIAYIGRNSGVTPVVDGVDITSHINSIIDDLNESGEPVKQIILQTAGDSESSIFRATIDFNK